MALNMDPEVATVLGPLTEAAASRTPPAIGDWQTRRAVVNKLLGGFASRLPIEGAVEVSEHSATAADGMPIPMRLYRSPGSTAESLVVYIHGGGMFLCSIDTHDPICRKYTAESGVALLSVDYRFAPEHPFPYSVDDCYAALSWAVQHAGRLGCDPDRVAVMGDSAGGGIAAAVALMARDRRGPALRRQILVYPMLDDRTSEPKPDIESFLTWTADDNVTGWQCLLGSAAGGPDVPPYAAPARAASLTDLPPTYLEVGQLDIFRGEVLAYAGRLVDAGVEVELHLRAGVPHAFEVFAPSSQVAQRAWSDRMRVLQSF